MLELQRILQEGFLLRGACEQPLGEAHGANLTLALHLAVIRGAAELSMARWSAVLTKAQIVQYMKTPIMSSASRWRYANILATAKFFFALIHACLHR